MTGTQTSLDSARGLHDDSFVFDGLSLEYVLDESYSQRLIEGGVNATNVTFSMGEEDWETTLRQVHSGLSRVDASDHFQLVRNADDIARANSEGSVGIVMGFQGASPIGAAFERLDILRRLGLRIIQLTYTGANLYGDGCGEYRDAGLSLLGREFIREVNSAGLILDLSHCGERTTLEAIEIAERPVVSHANCLSVQPNSRNKSDEIIRAVAEKGSLIGMCCLPRAVGDGDITIERLLDHFEHALSLVGDRHVGIGLDLTEAYRERGVVLPDSRRWRTLRPDIFGGVSDFVSVGPPRGLESVADLPNLTAQLLNRGISRESVRNMLGRNWLSILRD